MLQAERCFLAYHNTYNAFFMDLPVSFFVFHSSLLTAKGDNLVVHMMVSFALAVYFIVATLITEMLFKISWFVLTTRWNGYFTHQTGQLGCVSPLTGAHGTIGIFSVATLVAEVLFEQFLDSYCCAMGQTYSSCQRHVMDTSLSEDKWYNRGTLYHRIATF